MKNLLTGVVVVFGLILGAWFAIEQVFRGGDTYYTQITTNGERRQFKDDAGNAVVDYYYKLPGFDASGRKIKLGFYGSKPRPLKRNAYLKVIYHHGDVRSWEQLSESDVPEKALSQLKMKQP
ncbi:YxeA family protein [Lapidilactobacillus bayanensis]|uniref:YxeA family protein n=1 Tax=Lapidilactobacillus bayanensis TaxID=2485998 RepID=UPI001CDC01BB|nr:YxeA family protein [Lapidilactobacillus bayanensis]